MTSFTKRTLGATCALFAVVVVTTASAQAPILVFSDLVSAPASGWSNAEPGKGAVVTVWGRNLGALRGENYVTVNGVALTSGSDYPDTWGKRNNPVTFLETITFHLKDSMSPGNGTISVTVDGVTSNALPFRINQSRIRFVDINAGDSGNGSFESPYSDPMGFIDSMGPGDVAYFREGTYNERFDGGKSVIWIRPEKASGTSQDPIGLVAYPGEDVHMDSLANGDKVNFNRTFQTNTDYITIAKFRVTAHLRAIWPSGNYNRVIGNDVIGAVEHAGGSGSIHSGADGTVVYGNSVHGARSGNRLDHAIYIDGCQDKAGADVAYNYIWDNDVERGPLLVDNHQNDRCRSGTAMKSNFWHHNVISAERFKSRCLGIYDLSWDAGESQEPDPAYVYNNIFIGCGDAWQGAFYHQNGYAFIYNNTFVDSKGKSIQLYNNASNEPILGSTIVNNVFIRGAGVSEPAISNDGADESVIHVDNNFYENSPPYASDGSAVTGSTDLIVDSSAYHPVIVGASSPLINAGSQAVSGVVRNDFYIVDRPTIIDIGAVEFAGEIEVAVRPNPPSFQ